VLKIFEGLAAIETTVHDCVLIVWAKSLSHPTAFRADRDVCGHAFSREARA
jgi:hypothetical protein